MGVLSRKLARVSVVLADVFHHPHSCGFIATVDYMDSVGVPTPLAIPQSDRISTPFAIADCEEVNFVCHLPEFSS